MKIKTLMAAILMTLSLGVGISSISTPVSASSWHRGTPKVAHGNWYYYRHGKPRGRTQVTKNLWAFNSVSYSSHFHAYFNRYSLDFLQGLRYRYIGHHKYIISGISEGGQCTPPIGKRRNHVVQVGKSHMKQFGVKLTRHKPAHMVGTLKGSLNP
jgi:hypothetical protein